MWPILVGLLAVVFFLFYKNWVSNYNYWKKRGFPYVPGVFPFGSHSIYSLRKADGPRLQEIYDRAGQAPYFGFYNERSYEFVIKDPEIVRLILTKEFSHFRDRYSHMLPKDEPLLYHQLFTLKGDRWRALRIKLTPTFTSGKMKGMYPLFLKCSEAVSTLIKSKIGSTIEVKDISARFTTDVICSCAFGLQTNTIENPDHPLRKLAVISNRNTSYISYLVAYAKRLFFKLVHILTGKIHRFRITDPEYEKYIMKLVADTIDYREKNNVKRNDFLDLLIHLKNKEAVDREDNNGSEDVLRLTLEVIAAQCSVFFSAGFETSSSVQTFCLYELALNQEIQQKLRNEIEDTLEKHGEMTYEAVQEMEYLHMVISETMRKYPILVVLNRLCEKDLTLPAGHQLQKGDNILIPVWSLHHDPDNFPNPAKFDPERFSKENQESIKPYSYLPFGEGPRMCIGNRFGLLQTKVGLITFIRNCRVVPSDKTTIPLELKQTGTPLIGTKHPVYLKLESLECHQCRRRM